MNETKEIYCYNEHKVEPKDEREDGRCPACNQMTYIVITLKEIL